MIVIEYKLWLTEIVTKAQARGQVIPNTASSLLEKKGFPFGFWTWLKRSASILLPIKCISKVHQRWRLTSALLTQLFELIGQNGFRPMSCCPHFSLASPTCGVVLLIFAATRSGLRARPSCCTTNKLLFCTKWHMLNQEKRVNKCLCSSSVS